MNGVVDVAYGFEMGLNEAIERAASVLGQARLTQERTLLRTLYTQVCATCEQGAVCACLRHLVCVVALGAKRRGSPAFVL